MSDIVIQYSTEDIVIQRQTQALKHLRLSDLGSSFCVCSFLFVIRIRVCKHRS